MNAAAEKMPRALQRAIDLSSEIVMLDSLCFQN